MVATDRNTALLGPVGDLGVTVLQHDVLVDEPPGEFDLIHTRYVLEHLPVRGLAIQRMVSWLRPGGWLVVDGGSTVPELATRPVVARAMLAATTVLGQRVGTRSTWSRCLPGPLIAAGLPDCGAEAAIPPTSTTRGLR